MSWEPTVTTSPWGRIQVIVDDVDVTYFRGVPTNVRNWSSGDPFDDATCELVFPQISPFEKLGVGELSWIKGHANVDILLVRPDNSTKKLWEGMTASIEEDTNDTSSSLVVQCIGALYQLDYYIRSPKFYNEGQERYYEKAIEAEFYPPNKEREALRLAPLRIDYPPGMENIGWETTYTGAWDRVLTGYIQTLLADMVHNTGSMREPGSPAVPGVPGKNAKQEIVLGAEAPPWPWGSTYPSRTLNGTFQLEFRGEKTPGRTSASALKWNATAADVKAALEALSTIDEVNVTGNGTNDSPWVVTFVGSKVRQKKQPAIRMYHSDLRHEHGVTRVTIVDNGEKGTPDTPAVPESDPDPYEGSWTLLKDEGRVPVLKMRDETTRHWTVSAGAPGVAHSLKSDFSQSPNVFYGEGTDESATTWRNSVVDVEQATEDFRTVTHYYPLAWDESVYPADRDESEAGEPTDPAPAAYSTDNIRVEVMQRYGSGVSLKDAKRSALQQLRKEYDPGWFGSITLTSDPEEGSRYEIKAGQNILLKHYRGMTPPKPVIFEELKARSIFLEEFSTMPMLRGQFMSVLLRTLEDHGVTVPASSAIEFSDVAGTTHVDSINRLSALDIALGYPDGTFRPNEPLTREQMAAFILRAAEWAGGTPLTASRNHFNDRLDSLQVFREDINKVIENDLVTMYPNGSFFPDQEASRLEAGESMYLLNRFLGGNMLADAEGLFLHIAQVEANIESGTVDLTVDTKFRDLATLDQLIERAKSENKNPAKMLMANRESANTDDTKFPWDYDAGSGSIPTKARTPRAERLPVMPPEGKDFEDYFVYVNGSASDPWDRWTVVPVVAAGKGTIQKSEIRAYNSQGQPLEIPFFAGVYSNMVNEHDMPQDPNVEDIWLPPSESENSLSGYHSSAVVLWGQGGQRAGYWPGLESEGDSPTGILIDEGTWQFQLPEMGEQLLYVAIYAEVDAYFQGRFYHGVQD